MTGKKTNIELIDEEIRRCGSWEEFIKEQNRRHKQVEEKINKEFYS